MMMSSAGEKIFEAKVHSTKNSFLSNNPVRVGILNDKRSEKHQKIKYKSRSLAKVLSAPIRRFYKRSRTSYNDKKKKNCSGSEQQEQQLKEVAQEYQNYAIEPAHTFDTQEVVVSPNSAASLTVGSIISSCCADFQDETIKYQILLKKVRQDNCTDNGEQDDKEPYQQTGIIEPDDAKREEDPENVIYCKIKRSQETSHSWNLPEVDLESNIYTGVADDIVRCRNPMSSRGQLSMIQDEESYSSIEDEVDSLAPAIDFSLHCEEDKDANDESYQSFTCKGWLSSPALVQDAAAATAVPPVEAISINCEIDTEEMIKQQESNTEEDLAFSLTSSYDSYLHAVENITSSVRRNNNVEQLKLSGKQVDNFTYTEVDRDAENNNDKESIEEEYEAEYKDYRVSFTPSNALYFQAMEGISAKAKSDIEEATSLALSKIKIAASSIEPKKFREAKDASKKSTVSNVYGYGCTHNLVWGLVICVLLFLFNAAHSCDTFLNIIIPPISNRIVVDYYYPVQQRSIEWLRSPSIRIENEGTRSSYNDILQEDLQMQSVDCTEFPCLFDPWLHLD